MKKRFIFYVLLMSVVFLPLSLTVGAEALQIDGNRFVKDDKKVSFLVNFNFEYFDDHSDACNAQFIGRKPLDMDMWDKFGKDSEVNEDFLKLITKQLIELKENKKIAVIQLFSALWFRSASADGRPTGVENTIWWNGGDVDELDKDDNKDQLKLKQWVDAAWDRFISKEGKSMQKNLINKVIKTAKRIEVDFTFSLMWESQVLSGTQRSAKFRAWFKDMKKFIKEEKGHEIPVGLHSINKDQIDGAGADFVVVEGNFAAYFGMIKNNQSVLDKPVIIIARNPGKFKAGDKCSTFEDLEKWDKVAAQLINEMGKEYSVLGSTGYPFPRWIDKEVMKEELESSDCDEAKKKLINNKNTKWDFQGFSKKISDACKNRFKRPRKVKNN